MNFYHDQQRDLLIYEGTSPLILQAIPEARQINGSFFAVPRSLRNSQILRYFNYPVAPVITDENYDWPIEPGRKPLEHQKMMANFHILHRRCFNLSDMGTMKTLAALWAADWLMMQHLPDTCRLLVVCTLSTMNRTWANAIATNFLGRRSFQILHHSNASMRRKLLEKPADIYIINADGIGVGAHTRKRFELDGFSKDLAERDDIKQVVVDECSFYRDASTKRHRIARLVIGKKPYLIEMTGTPTPNKPTDAHGLAKLMNNAFGKSFNTLRTETMIQVSNFVWKPKKDGYDIARRLLTPSIRFDIKDVWDGPEMTTQQREVPLTEQQVKLMADLKRDLQVMVRQGSPITAANEAAARQKFLQISMGAIYDERHKVHLIDARPRLAELREVIEQAPGKLLIFAGLTSVVELLYKELGPRKDARGQLIHPGWSREIVNGNVSQKERARIFQAFQSEPNPRLLIADPGTMAHGLDLYAAQTVVWYGPTDKTELYLQANKRAHRPGQKHPVTVVQIVSNKLEREIFHRLETNTTLQGALLDMVRKGEL